MTLYLIFSLGKQSSWLEEIDDYASQKGDVTTQDLSQLRKFRSVDVVFHLTLKTRLDHQLKVKLARIDT